MERTTQDPYDHLDYELEYIAEHDDNASIASESDDVSFLLDDWFTGVRHFDSFEFRYYNLRSAVPRNIYTNNIAFVDAIFTALNRNQNDNVTAVRLLADIHDLEDEENIRWNQNIRFEIDSFASYIELRQIMLEHLENDTAPVWHRLLTDETSDKGYNKMIQYHRDYFDLCVQRPPRTRTQVTTVCGEREIHPGVFIKIITDHGDIEYGQNDCLIQSLNEIFNKREDPIAIRKEIWPKGDHFKDLHQPKHITYLAKRYNTKLIIIDLLTNKGLVFNEGCKDNVVKLVKVGKMLGILDYVDYTVDKRNNEATVVYYDLETVGPEQKIYAFTWRHKDGDLTLCHNNSEYVESEFLDKVVTTLERAADDETIIAYAWNGSRFDNWIAFKLINAKYKKQFWIHDIIINSGNELLMFKVTFDPGNGSAPRHMVFKDPKKMFSVSIPEACKMFNIEGKHDFNHDDVDQAYMDGSFDEYIRKNRMKIMEYVRQDGVILEKVTNCIKEIYAKEDINMYSTLTRSVASSLVWQKTIENHKILKDVTLSPYAEICDGVKYNDIMDHAIGGRTQCVQQGTFQNVCGVDVNSMYPYVCATNLYPCGEITELKPHEIPPVDKLGIYYVRIKKQSYPNVIPYRKSKHYSYDWNYDKPFEKWITNIDMRQLDEYEIIKGFYWSDTTDKFYKAFMIENYHERCTIDKVDPKNLHIKLKMNGVTGSAFQHSFREMIMIFTKEQFVSNVKKYNELVKIVGCESINDHQYIVTMRPVRFNKDDPRIKAQREFCKGAITQKPWVLTMFTYSYARKELRDEWIKLEQQGCKVLYCDTDSLFFTNPDDVIKRSDYKDTKELGKWGVECWNDEGSFHSPKVYAIKNVGKLRIKGVGYNSLVIQSHHTNKDLNYEQKLQLYISSVMNKAKHPGYKDVVNLVNGTPLKTINFAMDKSKEKGITKKYVIKIIK